MARHRVATGACVSKLRRVGPLRQAPRQRQMLQLPISPSHVQPTPPLQQHARSATRGRAMKVRVGLPAGRVHEIALGAGATVSELEAAVVRAEDVPDTHRVRLIAAGKLLAEPGARVDAHLADGGYVHCAVSEKPPPPRARRARRPRSEGAPGDEEGRAAGARLPVLTAVDVDGEVRIVIPSLAARGFDRLGLSPDEVAEIRRRFRAARVRREGYDDSDEEIDVEMEEAWLSAALEEEEEELGEAEAEEREAHGEGEARVIVANGTEGTNTDFLFGCMCGYLFSVLALALLLDKNISKRWRVGIVAGVATNCAFGVLRSSLYTDRTGFPG